MITDSMPPAPQVKIGADRNASALLKEIGDIDPALLQKIVMAIAAAQKALRGEYRRAGLAAARQRGRRPGTPRIMTETHIAVARRMLAQGATRTSIAQTLKVSPTTLYLALKPYSAGPFPQMGPKPKLTAEQRQEIVAAVSSGHKTSAEIARLFKIHPVTVSRIVSQARAGT